MKKNIQKRLIIVSKVLEKLGSDRIDWNLWGSIKDFFTDTNNTLIRGEERQLSSDEINIINGILKNIQGQLIELQPVITSAKSKFNK